MFKHTRTHAHIPASVHICSAFINAKGILARQSASVSKLDRAVWNEAELIDAGVPGPVDGDPGVVGLLPASLVRGGVRGMGGIGGMTTFGMGGAGLERRGTGERMARRDEGRPYGERPGRGDAGEMARAGNATLRGEVGVRGDLGVRGEVGVRLRGDVGVRL